jgi:hypothetical protein
MKIYKFGLLQVACFLFGYNVLSTLEIAKNTSLASQSRDKSINGIRAEFLKEILITSNGGRKDKALLDTCTVATKAEQQVQEVEVEDEIPDWLIIDLLEIAATSLVNSKSILTTSKFSHLNELLETKVQLFDQSSKTYVYQNILSLIKLFRPSLHNNFLLV